MPEIKYKIGYSEDKIEPVEVERSTKKSVWIAPTDTWTGKKRTPRRHNRISEGECYFDTWEEAKEGLVKMRQCKIESLERTVAYTRGQIDRNKAALDQIEAMKKPEDI